MIKRIYVTGASGFVGTNLLKYFEKNVNAEFISIDRRLLEEGSETELSKLLSEHANSCLIHLAGKAHDVKKTSNPDDYYRVNTNLTKIIFNAFLNSSASCFIFMSSVKAAADRVEGYLKEDMQAQPFTDYGKSKQEAENYILSNKISGDKKIYILRPCMIHGPGNKGNLNLLYNIVKKGIAWPLGAFKNQRSFCSIDTVSFIIETLVDRNDIPNGIYHIADDTTISTNELIEIIAACLDKKPKILHIPKFFIFFIAKLGNILKLPINTERLQKLTETYMVSNDKIKSFLPSNMKFDTKEGIIKTIQSFK